MARYATLSDCSRAPAGLGEGHLEEADAYLDSVLWALSVDPAAVVLPHPALTPIAVAYASYRAAQDAIKSLDSPFIVQRDGYLKQAELLAGKLSRAALGLVTSGGGGSPAGGGYGSISFSRG